MIKKLVLLTTILAAPLCLAAPGEGKKKGDRKPPQFVIDKFDADGDGKLNESERDAAKAFRDARHEEMKELRQSYDLDGSGDLDDNEKAAFKEAMQEKIIEHFDEDGDGVLNDAEQANADEAKARREERHGKKGGPRGKKGPDGKKGKGPF